MTINGQWTIADSKTARLLGKYCEMVEKLESVQQRASVNRPQLQGGLQDTIKAHCRELGVQLRTVAMSTNAISVDSDGCPDGLCFDGGGCVPCDL